MKKPGTPFPLTGYYGPEYFCDREKETGFILDNIRSGRSIVLTAPRRTGKTMLMMHVLAKLPPPARGIYLDILPTENMNDFLNEFATALIRNISDRKGFGGKIWDFIRSLRPVITFDALTGSPQVTFDIKGTDVNNQIRTIFNFIEKQEEHYIIGIDEFQQILNYPEQKTDAWLRSVIQKMKNIVFVFTGSQQHLMNELFTIPSRPFYNSAGFLKLDKIEKTEYSEFISGKFKKNGRKISQDIIDQILEWTDRHTWYVQLLCSRVYIASVDEITEKIWKAEAARLLEEQETVFLNYRSMLTGPQWQLLKATALEGELYEPTASGFIIMHELGSPSTVLRSLKSLLKMELLYFDFDAAGRKFYKINDLLLRRWVESRE
jgi:DNA-binding transcriptional ArsR family regulator